jgi:glycosyltransferase involved in cell wall biosynthesis
MDQHANPLVSIVTPTYNRANYIEDTIVSVLTQSYRRIEYIVMDGRSTDNTVALLEEYRRRDPRLSYVSEKDDGMYDAINKGLEKAKGDILAYINSDDLYAPGVFDIVVDYFRANPEVDVVYGDTLVANPETGEAHINLYMPHPETWLRAGGIIAQPTVFMRRRCWYDVGGFRREVKYLGDCEYWLRLVNNGHRFGKINEIVAIEVNHGETLRSTMADEIAKEKRFLRQRYWPASPLGEAARTCVLLYRKVFTPFLYVRFILKVNRRAGRGAWGNFIRHYRPKASLAGYLMNKFLRTNFDVWSVDVIKGVSSSQS